MADVKFVVNSKMDIQYNDNSYKSDIQDVTEEYIAISIPIKEGQYIALNTSDVFDVIYYVGKEVYAFEGRVIGRRIENKIPQILIQYPKKIVQIQRREYVRIDVTDYIPYVKLDKSAVDINTMDKLLKEKGNKGLLIDLSGGGIRIKVKESLGMNDIIAFELTNDNTKLLLKGKVVRVELDVDKKPICGLEYMDIDNRTREKVISLIFAIMRKQRKTM